MAAVAFGALVTVATTAPSMAQVAGAQSAGSIGSMVERAQWIAPGGRWGYGRGYVGRGYGYRWGYGHRRGYGAGLAGAAVGAAIIGGALAAQRPYGYGYYAPPYGYGYAPGYYAPDYGYDGY
jgi:hypothetical protein